jgi:hypothetical protein
MTLRNSTPYTFKPTGVSDTADASNAFPGAMQSLMNLIPSADTDKAWVPRPAAVQVSSFAGFNTPGFVSAALVIGNLEYGMVASARNSGHDEPYAYNILTGNFLTVTGITAGNTPTSPATSGAWVPPIMAVAGTRVIVTHPGFPGGAIKFGWFDISSFSYTGTTTTNSTTTLTSATNLLQAGVQPGQVITKADVPAGTTVVSIAVGGLSLVMSAAATGSAAGATTIAGGTAASPLWAAGDTNINNLAAVPVSVAQFNGRAYYAVLNGVVFSDSLQACNVTNASQALTFANGLLTTALGALPLSSPITGGIVQSIIAFQGVSAMQQITGDQATTNLAVNLMNVATGTFAPLSITPTNFGLAFISPEGMRVVNFSGEVSDPIGDHGTGVTVPFIYAVQPPRICAASNADSIRISVQNGSAVGQPFQEYWFDISRKTWSGPHSFPASLIQTWNNTFIVHPVGIPGTIWRSDATVSSGSTYTENGAQLTFTYRTSLMPDNQQMAENSMVETTVAAGFPGGYSLAVAALNESGSVFASAAITTTGSITTWGAFLWGPPAIWGGSSLGLKQYQIPWAQPLVFKQASFMLTGNSLGGVKLGNNYFKFQKLGYLLQ